MQYQNKYDMHMKTLLRATNCISSIYLFKVSITNFLRSGATHVKITQSELLPRIYYLLVYALRIYYEVTLLALRYSTYTFGGWRLFEHI